MLQTAAQASTVLASLTIIFAVVAYRREIRGQNLAGLFYLHQYLAKDTFADARRISLTRLAHTPFAHWTEEDKEAAYRVCLSLEEAALLLGGEVLNDRGRALMLRSYWGDQICLHHEILTDYLASNLTPSLTGAQYFPNFQQLHAMARTIHRADGTAVHSVPNAEQPVLADTKAEARRERQERVAAMSFGLADLQAFIERHEGVTRESLVADEHLRASAPAKGTALLAAEDRTESGEALLIEAKDVLFALLFGDETMGCDLVRGPQELLTMAIPRAKADALGFMRAATELAAAGTWQDPSSVSNDERADNILLEVQYGEIEDELVGHGIVLALTLINNLEVNEQVLYARMIDIEQTSLIL